MRKGKTKSGFEFQIDEKVADNVEILEAIAEVEENEYKLPKLITMVLGEEQKKRLYDHLRTKKGNVPIKKTYEEFTEILELSGQKVKN